MSKILDDYHIETDPRFKQCFREAAMTLGLYTLHMVWTIGLAYGLWALLGPESRTFGLPTYLFWSVVVGSLLLILIVYLTTRYLYKDMPLDGNLEK